MGLGMIDAKGVNSSEFLGTLAFIVLAWPQAARVGLPVLSHIG
jgi:hypothetical protein